LAYQGKKIVTATKKDSFSSNGIVSDNNIRNYSSSSLGSGGRSEEIGEPEPIRKSVTRTFRFRKESDDALISLVDKLHTTQTNLINEIVGRYLDWTQFTSDAHSPFITLGAGTVISLLESLDDPKLSKIAREIGTEEAIDFIRFRWNDVTFENIVQYLELLSTYGNIGKVETSQRRKRRNGNGDRNGYERFIVSVRHHFGKRWSTFLGILICNLFTSSLSNIEANYEASTQSCFVTIKMLNKPSS
jgi:hypothetical protein